MADDILEPVQNILQPHVRWKSTESMYEVIAFRQIGYEPKPLQNRFAEAGEAISPRKTGKRISDHAAIFWSDIVDMDLC